jgi:polygalacturonase
MKNNLSYLCFLFCFYCLNASAQATDYSWNNLPQITQPVFKTDTFNIIKYGAKSDGIFLNTQSINNAINACSADGGGVVNIPKGFWLTGPLVLKSNVNLHLDQSALLQFTGDKSKYPLVEGNYEGHPSPRNQSPISGTDLVNIAITGKGIIDGNGDVWRAMGKDYVTEREWAALIASGGIVNGKTWFPSQSYLKGFNTKDAITLQPGKSLKDYESMKDFYRPNMVVLTNCKKILLQNATFQNSPAWCLHTLLCEDLTLQDVKVHNPWNAQNGDGIDVESCRNVLIEGSTFDVGDDGICVKSGRDEDGRKRGKPTENMIVRNNIVYRAHGGFVIGSEMSGGAKNIFVSDCSFIGTDIGLRFKTTRGRGGIVEKIYIKNINMKSILGSAILFDMYYGGKSVREGDGNANGDTRRFTMNEGTPQFKDFYVSNVVCDGAASGLLIRGLPEQAIKNIQLENVILKTVNGIEIVEANNISLKNVTIINKATNPVFDISNSDHIKLDGIKYKEHTELLFAITGARSWQIEVTHTNITQAKNKAIFKEGANEKSLTIK